MADGNNSVYGPANRPIFNPAGIRVDRQRSISGTLIEHTWEIRGSAGDDYPTNVNQAHVWRVPFDCIVVGVCASLTDTAASDVTSEVAAIYDDGFYATTAAIQDEFGISGRRGRVVIADGDASNTGDVAPDVPIPDGPDALYLPAGLGLQLITDFDPTSDSRILSYQMLVVATAYRYAPDVPPPEVVVFANGEHTWEVPAGVTSVTLMVRGAAGQGIDGLAGGIENTLGGRGAQFDATLAVTPGETLYLEVGDRGGTNPYPDGGPAGLASGTNAVGGFAGGGSTRLWRGSLGGTLLVHAGAGGGGARGTGGWDPTGVGGDAGIPTPATDGYTAVTLIGTADGGEGATSVAAGAAGTSPGGVTPATDGSGNDGGTGATHAGTGGGTFGHLTAGSGGGGGYFGGGGGGVICETGGLAHYAGSGAGGGGSSFASVAGSWSLHPTDDIDDGGYITFTYQP